jgi:mono/diheme cytochrome c family protein
MRSALAALTLLVGAGAWAELHVDRSDERVKRGEYLTLQVYGCQGCHTERALDRYGFPPKADRLLGGGLFMRAAGPNAISPNITPYALGDWTDQQIFDAITKGVRPDGRLLHHEMPYARYGLLEEEKIHDVIAYLRSIDPVEAGPYPAEYPETHEPFEAKLGTVVEPGPDAAPVERGEYLIESSGCNGCHAGTGPGVDGALLAGGRVFDLGGRGIVRAANLTPDGASGLGNWNEGAFMARFKAMRGSESAPVAAGEPNTVMHWWQYSYMSDEDLAAMYAYLQSLPAVANRVVRFEPQDGPLETINFSER